MIEDDQNEKEKIYQTTEDMMSQTSPGQLSEKKQYLLLLLPKQK